MPHLFPVEQRFNPSFGKHLGFVRAERRISKTEFEPQSINQSSQSDRREIRIGWCAGASRNQRRYIGTVVSIDIVVNCTDGAIAPGHTPEGEPSC